MPTPVPATTRRERRRASRRPLYARRSLLLPAGVALAVTTVLAAGVGSRDVDGGARVAESPTAADAVAGSSIPDEDADGAESTDDGTSDGTEVATTVAAPAEDADGVVRLSGTDRVGTAVAVAQDRFPDGAEAAVLATDHAFADALAGTALAKLYDAPLLLNPTDELDDRVAEELTDGVVEGSTVYVLGGDDALSTDVSDAIIDLGFVVSRVAGPDRYATAAAVAGEVLRGSDAPCQLVVATGTDFADGASAAGYVSADRPLVYSRGDAWPKATGQALSRCADGGSSSVTAVGGDAAEAVTAAAERYDGEEPQVTAVAGTDRYDTSSQLAALVASQGAAGAGATAAAAGAATLQQGSRVLAHGTRSHEDGSGESEESEESQEPDEAARESFAERAQEAADDEADGADGAESSDGTSSAESTESTDGADLAETRAATAAGGVARVVLASGDDYTDALVGGTYGGPVLLTRADRLPTPVARVLADLGAGGAQLLVIGGADAVSPQVAATAQAALGGVLPAEEAPAPSPSASSSPSGSAGSTGSTPSAAPAPSASSGGASAAPASSAKRGGVPNLSGLAWNSGVYIPGSKQSKQDAFAAWRGTPNDVVVDWAARSNWNDVVNPSWLYDAWRTTKMTKVFGTAMIPEDGSGSISSCAAGAYDDKWRQFGSNIAKAGIADTTIIRLGWEFNGDWYAWAAKDPATWAQCWRKIHTAAESTAPGLRWDWTVNRGRGQSVADATKAYPGDAYVDIVGVDSYDGYPAATSEAGWNEQYSGAYGLKFWKDFAIAHGKALSVPEWGVYPGTAWKGNNGGDNAFYIEKMNGFFKEVAPILAYEAYFNESASYYAGSLYGPTQNPKAAARYQQLW